MQDENLSDDDLTNNGYVEVGATAVHVLVKLDPNPVVKLTSIATEVMLKYGPTSAITTNQNVEILVVSPANVELPWMGLEMLVSTTPAVQSQFAWMGLEILVPALPKISVDWMGLEVLVDKRLLVDLPEYLDFGNVYNGYPGQSKTSFVQSITGLTDELYITIYTKDAGLELSTDGVNYSSSISVTNDDQVHLRKTLEKVFNQEYLVYTDSSFTGETEIGIWEIVGPSGTLKYDDFEFVKVEKPLWDEYKKTNHELADMGSEFNETSMISIPAAETLAEHWADLRSSAPTSEQITNANMAESNHANAHLVSVNTLQHPVALISTFDDQSSEIKFADADEGHIEPFNSLISLNERLVAYFALNRFNTHEVCDLTSPNVLPHIFGHAKSAMYDMDRDMFRAANPLDAFEAKISSGINWRIVATQFIMSNCDDEKLVDVQFEKLDSEDDKTTSLIPAYWVNWANRNVLSKWRMENHNLKSYAHAGWKILDNETSALSNTMWKILDNETNATARTNWEIGSVDNNIDVNGIRYEQYSYPLYCEVNSDPYFINLSNTVSYSMQATTVNSEDRRVVNVLYTYQYALDKLKTNIMNSSFDTEIIYNSLNYIRQGGYATYELAEDAVSAYPSENKVIYQQPEGTFSYNIIYTNAVWCGDIPIRPGLRAVAWYLGGG